MGYRGSIAAAVATLVAVATLGPTAHARQPGGVPVVVLEGRGWGHGVGMAQWGAKHAADRGAGTADILAHFYPGTDLAQMDGGVVRVVVLSADAGVATLQFPAGGEIRSAPEGEQAAGFPVVVEPGGTVTVRHDGGYRVEPATPVEPTALGQQQQDPLCVPLLGPCPPPPPPPDDGSGTGGGGGSDECLLGCPSPATDPPPPTDPPPIEPGGPPEEAPGFVSPTPVWAVPYDGATTAVVDRDRRYRGLIEATAAAGPLRLVNHVPVETYLEGMGEVPSSWPPAAIEAQTVAARTYALRAMAYSGELCDSARCQVYIGADRETPGQSAAVRATHGLVVTHGGALASTVYSADAGGVTATTEEGFGTSNAGYPYLRSVRYDTPDPLPWSVSVALADIASRFGYPGEVTGVSVGAVGPSGRAMHVVLDGSAGRMAVDGRQFASRLSLRSTLFTTSIGWAAEAPVPPPDAGDVEALLQALPDDAASLQAAIAAPQPAVSTDRASRAAPALRAPPPVPARTSDPTDVIDDPAAWLAAALVGIVTVAATGSLRHRRPFHGPFSNPFSRK